MSTAAVQTKLAAGNDFIPGDLMADLAQREAPRRLLTEYERAISVLRDEKHFTFREIAEWLGEHGVDTDHNAVYRAYARTMTESEAQEAAFKDATDEGSNA